MHKKLSKRLNIVTVTALFLLISITVNAYTLDLKIIDTAGCNLAIVDETAQNVFSLKSTSGAHNWFAGVFNGLDTSNLTIFTLDMNDTGTLESPGDVSKWDGLWPVYTYGKYWDYNTYIYYTKNYDGYWVSSDIFAKDKLAGNGKTPIQNVISAEFAEEFLSEDKKYWSVWQDIQDTKINAGSNIFYITNQFNSPNASIAMRVPYTYDYEHEYMKKLKQANVSGITVHEIGKSIRNHNLYVVEVSDPKATVEELKERRVVLMYADEDGDEPDGCWVVNGAMNYLIQGLKNSDKEVNKILSEVTFLFIPLLDPVGWSNSTYGEMTSEFSTYYISEEREPRLEVICYASFIASWCGDYFRRLDIIVNMHNIECNEGPNIFSPVQNINRYEESNNLNKFILSRISNVNVGMDYFTQGYNEYRYSGWCCRLWGCVPVAYEINSRYPNNRLEPYDLDNLGESLVMLFFKYFNSDEYEKALPTIEKAYMEQTLRRNSFLKNINIKNNYYTIGEGF